MQSLDIFFENVKRELNRLESENKLLKYFLSTVEFSELKTDFEECQKANEDIKKTCYG